MTRTKALRRSFPKLPFLGLEALEGRDVPAAIVVDTAFDGSTPGFGTTAFNKISDAFAIATAADTIDVHPGDYTVLDTVTANLTVAAPVTFSGPVTANGLGATAGSFILNGDLTFGDANNTSIAAVISGPSNLIKQGTGTVTVTATNTYTGTTTINAGILATTASAGLGDVAGATTVNVGGTLSVSGAINVAEPITINGDGATAGLGAIQHTGTANTTYSGVITLGSPARINSIAASPALFTLTPALAAGGNSVTFGGSGQTKLAGSVSSLGAGSLLVDGTGGRLTLTFASNWPGEIKVTNGGTLSYSSITHVAGTGLITLDNGTLLNTQVIGTGGNGSFLPSATAGANRNVFLGDGGGTWLWNGGSGTALIIFGPISTVTGTGGLTTNSVNSDGVTKSAAISVSSPCTYAGDTHVTGGVLRVRTTADRFPVSTNLIVDAGAEFNPNGVAQRIGSLAGSGNITLGSATLTIGNTTGTNRTFSGVISGTGRVTTLPPTGVSWNNTQTLTGASTYTNTGNLVTLVGINGGTLILGNSTGSALGTNTAVAATQNVQTGGVLGSVSTSNDGSTVTPLNILGTVAPGNIGFTGRLTTGDITINTTGVFDADIKGTTAGFGPTGYDQLVVNGVVTLGSGAKLNFNNTGLTSALGDSFRIIDNDGTDVINGIFKDTSGNDLIQNALFMADNQLFRISYTGGTGNDVVITRANAFDKYYVSPAFTGDGTTVDGDPVLAGSQDAVVGTKAFSTIAAALAASKAGDQIVINAGTYAEAVDLGTSSRQLVFQEEAITINSLNGSSAATIMTLGTKVDGVTGILLTFGGDNASTTFAGSISGPGGIIYSGDGTFTLSGVNSYSGLTSIVTGPGGNGRWVAGSTAALSVVSPFDLTNARLSLNGFSNQIGNLSGNAGSVVENGSSISNAVLSAGASKTAGGVFELTFDGTMRDGAGGKSYGFVKLGIGTLTIPNNYAYTGPFTLGGGTYSVDTLPNGGVAGPFGASSSAVGNFTISGGARLNYTGPATTNDRNINWGSGGGTLDIGANDVTLSGVLTSAGGLLGAFIKEGAGKLTFTNANAFQGGAVNSQTAYAPLATGNVTVNAGELNIGNLRLKGQYRGTSTEQRTLTIGVGATVTTTGTIAIDPSSTYVTVIGGAGTLKPRNTTADKANNPTIAFDYGPSGGDSVPFGSRIATPVDFGDVPAFIIGKADHNDVARLGGDLIFNGAITGTAALNFVGLSSTTHTKSSNVHFVLNTSNPNFTGNVFIANSDLALTNNTALSSVNNVTFNSTPNAATTNRAALFLFGHAVTIGSLNDVSANGTTSQIRNGSQATAVGGTGTSAGASGAYGLDSDSTLTVTQTTDGTFTGAILDGPYDFEDGTAPSAYRKSNFVKEGTAKLTLSGTSTSTGSVSVNAGSVIQNGSFAAPVTAITDTTVGGSGTYKALTTNGGRISAGTDGTAGTLNLGNTTINGGTLVVDLLGTTPGTQYDQLKVTGTIDLNGVELFVNNTIAPAPVGTTFVLIDNDGTDPINGTFTLMGVPLAEGDFFTAGGTKFQITYIGGSGNDACAVAVPSGSADVTGFVVNNGATQRSRLTSITVNFSGSVSPGSFTNPGDIKLTRYASTAQGVNGTIVQTGATGANGLITVSQPGPTNQLVLTFSNADSSNETSGVEYGSLADGKWQLTIPGANNYIQPIGTGDPLIVRLFGNFNGDTTVDATDFGFFPPLGSNVDNPFDYNGNNDIDSATDFSQFGNRFGLTL